VRRLGAFCLSDWKGSIHFNGAQQSYFNRLGNIIKSGKCYIKFKMLCIDLSLKYVNFEGIQWVPLAESGWRNVLCQ